MKQIRFGTSSWRDVIVDRFTFADVRLVARATAEQLLAWGIDHPQVVVGYDTRFLSEAFAAEAAAARALLDV